MPQNINTINNAALIILLLFLLTINLISFFRYILHNKKNEEYKKSFISYLFKDKFHFFVMYFNIYFIVFLVIFFIPNNNSNNINDENDISKRITAISNSLKETATELSVLQLQLENRIDFVENLQKEAEIAEDFLSLSEDQINAIQSKTNEYLNKNSFKSTMTSFLISALFFVLGYIIQPIINFFKKKNKQNVDKDIDTNQYNQEELFILLNEVKSVLESNNKKSSKTNE